MKKLFILSILLFLIPVFRIIQIRFINYDEYYAKYLIKANNDYLGSTAPRGNILDSKGRLIAYNEPINNIYYRYIKDVTFNIDDIANILDINNEDLEMMMNKGYLKSSKLLKEDVSNDICIKISELNINGLNCKISWKRKYNYPLFQSIIGNIGYIPKEEKDIYLANGYKENDKVGISGLEKYYDNILKGTKAQYKINLDNSLTKISDEIKGEDLVLSLDIDIENKALEILKKYLLASKKMVSTDYYDHAYIIVSDPNNGNIIALAGLRRNKDDSFTDIASLAMSSSYTVGSVVKGASHTVGYLNDKIDINKKILDSCVKLNHIPSKCSFKRLGYIDDISALKTSSNYYQFITAIKVAGYNYKPNLDMEVNEDTFNKYRDIFKLYGLGSLTNIDYPKEKIGIIGDKIAPDLLLNLAIGQYDTYTPIELVSYINTIANNGKRYSLSFKKQDNNIIDEVPLDIKYYDRIKKGFYDVVNKGTGKGYTDYKYQAAGKTGTSQTYYNKDINTITQSYIMFAPYDNPKYSMVIVNPNVSYEKKGKTYQVPINHRMSREMSDYLLSK